MWASPSLIEHSITNTYSSKLYNYEDSLIWLSIAIAKPGREEDIDDYILSYLC
jgi:hypothetical protein